MNRPEAALYSLGPGVKPGGGEPVTVMLTVGAGDKEKKRIHCAVIDRDYTCTSDGDNMTSCINQLAEWPNSLSLPNVRGSCMLLVPLDIHEGILIITTALTSKKKKKTNLKN